MYEIGLGPESRDLFSLFDPKIGGTTNDHWPTRSPKDRHKSDFWDSKWRGFVHQREGLGPKTTTSYETTGTAFDHHSESPHLSKSSTECHWMPLTPKTQSGKSRCLGILWNPSDQRFIERAQKNALSVAAFFDRPLGGIPWLRTRMRAESRA